MTLKRLLLFSISLFSIAVFAERVKACTCAEHGTPVCAAFWRADAVFVGQVTDIREPKAAAIDPGSEPTAMLHFIVEQPFRGITATQVDVATLFGTSCDMPFKKGARYLIYADVDRGTKQLFAGPCSGTTLLKDAVDDLNYIRTVTQQGVSESISGLIVKNRYEGLPQLKVEVTGGGKTWETNTDADGKFSISLPGPGVYKVRASIPFAAAVIRYESEPQITVNATDTLTTLDFDVKLEKNHCEYLELPVFEDNLHATAEITGRVLTASGSGLDKGSIYLVKAAKPDDFFKSEKIEANGLFKFQGLTPGEYYIVLNFHNQAPSRDDAPYPRTYYPGVSSLADAVKVAVVEGGKLENLTLRLDEPFTVRTISGIVEWPDGRKAIGGRLNIRTRDRFVEQLTVEQDGTFNFQVYGGFEYEIQAESWKGQTMVTSQKVRVTPETQNVKLVLRN